MMLDDDIDELNNIIKDKNYVLKFYANWCKNCHTINDNLNQYCTNNNCLLVSIDIDDNQSIMEHYGITKLPTIIINSIKNKFEGATNINNYLDSFMKIDINEDF